MTIDGDTKILVADGDPGARALLVDALRRAGLVGIEAEDGEEALEAADAERPAAVVTEVTLRGASGYTVCRRLRDRYGASLPIIFVSSERTESMDRISGLLLGADDYVVKPLDPDEVAARVSRALERAAAFGASDDPTAREETSYEPLTPREQEVLELLTRGLSQAEIAGELVISSRTVGTHIQRTLTKLGVHSRAQAVALALRHQLVAGSGGAVSAARS